MNRNNILCYDLETDSKFPSIAQIIQISGKIIDPYTLEIVDSFTSWMRPTSLANEETIEWHAKQRKISVEEMWEKVNGAPETEVVWKKFVKWVQKYNKGKNNSPYTAPISAGYNIIGYDNPIMKRYCKEYGPWDPKADGGEGNQKLFNQVWKIDMMDHMFYWFESNTEVNKLGQVAIMSHMGVPDDFLENAHDAEVDTEMSAKLLIKFFKLQRHLTEVDKESGKSRLKMKGCMEGVFSND